MNQKNYTEVLIDGKIYTLGGAEEELYLQKVAAYLNEKIGRLKKQDGFGRMSADYQFVMEALNLADDYFKEQERADLLAEQKAAMEKETYSLKHQLITNQMKLESVQKELEEEKKKCRELEGAAASHYQEFQKAADEKSRKFQTESEEKYQRLKAEAEAKYQELEKKSEEKCRELERESEEKRQEMEKAAEARYQDLKREADAMKAELQKFKALQSAAAAASQNHR